MAKKFPAHLVKTHRVYTILEAADCLGCHRHTVLRWVKAQGLPADQSARPWLIEGRELKSFLGHRQAKKAVRLALHNLYCLGCRSPQEPDGKVADYTHQSTTSGRLTGLCPACGAVMNKIIARKDLPAIEAKLEVTLQQASPRLVSCEPARPNVHFEEEQKTHAKAAR